MKTCGNCAFCGKAYPTTTGHCARCYAVICDTFTNPNVNALDCPSWKERAKTCGECKWFNIHNGCCYVPMPKWANGYNARSDSDASTCQCFEKKA